MTSGRITQAWIDDAVVDFGVGQPDPELLPVADLQRAAARVFDRYGPDVLGYGAPAGPPPTIAFIRDRLAVTDARVPATDEVVTTAGNSHGLEQVVTLATRPGDAVLVESPTYHLALRILGDHPVEIVGIPSDEGGLRVDAVASALVDLRRRGIPARLLYTVPTFNNPTGRSLAADRRQALVDLAAEESLTIVEDDTYRELVYEGVVPPSLWSLGAPGTVIRLGSFSKSLSPGLRAGFITADAAMAERIVDSGLIDSGGGISHVPSLIVAEYASGGAYATNVERLRNTYRERRDALAGALTDRLDGIASFDLPTGGYFLWVRLHDDVDAAALRIRATEAGVGFVPGSVFHADGADGRDIMRLAFSRYPSDVLVEGARRLANVVRSAA